MMVPMDLMVPMVPIVPMDLMDLARWRCAAARKAHRSFLNCPAFRRGLAQPGGPLLRVQGWIKKESRS